MSLILILTTGKKEILTDVNGGSGFVRSVERSYEAAAYPLCIGQCWASIPWMVCEARGVELTGSWDSALGPEQVKRAGKISLQLLFLVPADK